MYSSVMPFVPSKPLPEANNRKVTEQTDVTTTDNKIKLFIPTIKIVNNVWMI